MSAPAQADAWVPNLSEYDHDSWRTYLLGTSDAVVVSLWTDENGRIVHFAMVQQTALYVDDEAEPEWVEVAKVDCAHGEVHVHRYSSTGRELSKKAFCTINSPDDVTAGYEYAQTVIFDQWEENLRRWEYGR